jgi:Polysaccharide pyruvyl transferase
MTGIFVGQNFFGAGNFGDDLTLAGFLNVAARHPEVTVTACTAHDLAACRYRFPEVRWLADEPALREDAVRQADVWLGLGDTPFQLESGPWLLEHNDRERRRCAALGKPMYLLGVGCESRAAVADPRSRSLLAAVQHVWTRDEFTAATLRPFVEASRLSAGADTAHLTFDGTGARPDREPGVVGLLLAFERREQFDLDELARLIARRPAGRMRWLVQEQRVLPYLERWILEHLAPEARSRLAVTDLAYATSSTDDYLRAFGAPEATITSRYHGALVAAWHGSKVLAVLRSAKLRGIADDFDLPRIDRIESHPVLEATLASAVEVPLARLRDARARAEAMCEAFFAACATSRTPHRPASPPLAPESFRVAIDAEIPPTLRPTETVVMRCTVTNRGDAAYVSSLPNPVELCYRWYDELGAVVGAGTWLHTALPRPLEPGGRIEVMAQVAAPATPGAYTLALTLLQENVAWFDDLDPTNGICRPVRISAPEPSPRP